MPAYMVITREKIRNQAEYEEYKKMVGPSLATTSCRPPIGNRARTLLPWLPLPTPRERQSPLIDGQQISAECHGLFISQSEHGIDAHGAARGDVTRRESDNRQQDCNASKSKRVGGGHADEEAR
jgi:hypothetical protein